MSGGTKSMTKNKTEGPAWGRAKKTGGVWLNTLSYNLSFIKPNIWVFCPVGLSGWGVEFALCSLLF